MFVECDNRTSLIGSDALPHVSSRMYHDTLRHVVFGPLESVPAVKPQKLMPFL